MISNNIDPLQLPAGSASDAFSNIDPLDGRYFSADISKYLSEEARIRYQAHVEVALAHTLAEFNLCSEDVFKEIQRSAQKVTAEQVHEEEKSTRHDIKALVNVIKQNVSDDAKPYVHFMATSNDIVNTALVLQYRDVITEVIAPSIKELMTTLIGKTNDFADTTQIGRTHGQHGVPVTFGYSLAEYVERLGVSYQRILELNGQLKGKFSGAVGAYNAQSVFVDDPKDFEAKMLSKLGLEPVPYATQVTPPEMLMRLLDELSIAAGVMANLATDMRHLQRSEIAEIREEFGENQTGSSTMAHKRNPISFENVGSQFKQVLGQITSAKLNLISEHQRDLTDSAAMRYYPVLIGAVNDMTRRLNKTMAKIVVDEESMQRNLQMSGGAIAAEPLYLLLAKNGVQNSHEKVKKLSHIALDSGRALTDVIKNDDEVSGIVENLDDSLLKILDDPAQNYTGLASERAKTIAQKWADTLK